MGTKDPRVDAYIAKAAPFARPILEHLRAIVHRAAPDCAEAIKWSAPFFEQAGVVCMMAAFQAHCSFGFWKGSLVFDSKRDREAMGQFGRIEKVSDLPPEREIAAWIRKAVELNLSGRKVKRPLKHPKAAIAIPADFADALKRNRSARTTFDALPPSGRRDYLEWIVGAKADATRARRLATSIEWLAEGKPRMWKYQKPASKPPAAIASRTAPAKSRKTLPKAGAKPSAKAPPARRPAAKRVGATKSARGPKPRSKS